MLSFSDTEFLNILKFSLGICLNFLKIHCQSWQGSKSSGYLSLHRTTQKSDHRSDMRSGQLSEPRLCVQGRSNVSSIHNLQQQPAVLLWQGLAHPVESTADS